MTEVENIFFAYQMAGDFEESEIYKTTLNFFDNIFQALRKINKISENTYTTLDEALGELVSTAHNDAFRYGFARGLGIKKDLRRY